MSQYTKSYRDTYLMEDTTLICQYSNTLWLCLICLYSNTLWLCLICQYSNTLWLCLICLYSNTLWLCLICQYSNTLWLCLICQYSNTMIVLDMPVSQHFIIVGMFMGNRQIIASGSIVVSRLLWDPWNKLSECVVYCDGSYNRLLLFVD